MTLHEAYLKAKNNVCARGLTLLVSCTDYGDFWGFVLMPPTYDKNDKRTWVGGGGNITVNKKNGAIGFLSWPKDIAIFDKGKPISIDEVVEKAAVA